LAVGFVEGIAENKKCFPRNFPLARWVGLPPYAQSFDGIGGMKFHFVLGPDHLSRSVKLGIGKLRDHHVVAVAAQRI